MSRTRPLTFTKDIDGKELSEANKKLFKSAEESNFQAAEEAIKEGAVVSIQDETGATPLHVLFRESIDPTPSLITLLASSNSHIDLPVLHPDLPPIGEKPVPEVKYNTCYAPIHYAARKDHLKALKVLAGAGANLGTLDGDGDTIIHLLVQLSIYRNKNSILLYAISKSASERNIALVGLLSEVDKEGHNPLDLAVLHHAKLMSTENLEKGNDSPYQHSLSRIQMLAEGGNVEANTKALKTAIEHDQLEEISALLLINGAQVEALKVEEKSKLDEFVRGKGFNNVNDFVDGWKKEKAAERESQEQQRKQWKPQNRSSNYFSEIGSRDNNSNNNLMLWGGMAGLALAGIGIYLCGVTSLLLMLQLAIIAALAGGCVGYYVGELMHQGNKGNGINPAERT